MSRAERRRAAREAVQQASRPTAQRDATSQSSVPRSYSSPHAPSARREGTAVSPEGLEESGSPESPRAAANHANAQQKSPSPTRGKDGKGATGPRTPEGKVRSRQNALTHGLYARTLAGPADLLGDDLAHFESLHETLLAEYAPEGGHEERMVEELVLGWWRLDRLRAHAQRRLADELTAGVDPVTALINSEKIATAEARLQRAIARLHRDLLFLARYRQRTQKEEAKRDARKSAADLDALIALEAEAMLRQVRARRQAEREGPEVGAHPEPAARPEAALVSAVLPGESRVPGESGERTAA